MPQYWNITDADQLKEFLDHAAARKYAGKEVWVELKKPESVRSEAQSNAMHLWFDWVAEKLNASGISIQAALAKRAVEVDWSGPAFKEIYWKPLLKVIEAQDSTKKQSKTGTSEVHETLCRHFAKEHDLVLPDWPTREM